jgi:aminopeptidase-like protein
MNPNKLLGSEDKVNSQNHELEQMDLLFDQLFPICRSITGSGVRKTLEILSEKIPRLEVKGVKSGAKVFDWEIPKEWRIHEAWLKGPDGKTIVDLENHNLHIVNYSVPVDQKIPLQTLQGNLYTNKNLPDAIPYVISYYRPRWGFCMTYNEYEKLTDGVYHAYINSELVDGELNYGHAILKGETDKEILISSYICHPSMANNELSGPVVATFLHQRLAQWKKRRFTYRFVFVPETIGSITYLHQHGNDVKQNIHTGMVLTCLGGNRPLSYKMSRNENAPINHIVQHVIKTKSLEAVVRPFTPIHGSDERQYSSPGFNLPIGQMSRMVYGNYPEYHTSLDNKGLMGIESLLKSVNEIELILRAIELDGYYVNQCPYGEVKLDKHGLYPDINEKGTGLVTQKEQLNKILMLLNYADGEHSLTEIAEKCNCTILDLESIVMLLKDKDLIKGPFIEKRGLTT